MTSNRLFRLRKTILVGSMLVALAGGCTKDSDPITSPQAEIDVRTMAPLAIGNTWHYLTITYTDIAPPDTTLDSIVVRDTTSVNGRLCYNLSGLTPGFSLNGRSYLAAADAGDFSIYECVGCLAGSRFNVPDSPIGWQARHYLKSPGTLNSSWQIADGDTTYGGMRVISADSTVITPAGTFNHCIVVQSTLNSAFQGHSITFAPGVGIVRTQYFGGLDGSVSELASYSLR